MLRFSQFVAIVRHGWGLCLGVCITIVFVVTAASLLLPKRYTAAAAVVVDVRAPELLNPANALDAGWVPSYVTTQIDVLKSERVALKAIEAVGLDRDPAQREAWLAATKGQGDFRRWLAARLQKRLDVKTSLQSNALYVAYTANEAELAANVVNAVVQGYISTAAEMRAEPTRRFSAFFDERARKLRAELEAAQARLSAYQRANGILAKDERLDAETARLNELSLQLIAMQAQVAESASRRAQAAIDPTRSPDVLGNPLVSGLIADLNRQQERLEELTTRLDEGHPQVIQARASIDELRRRISDMSSKVSSGVASVETVNRSRLARLEASLAEQRAKVLKLNERRDQVEVLVRDVEHAQKAYELVLTRAAQTSLESENTQTNVTVLQHASPPPLPTSPNLPLNVAIAFICGLLVSVGAIVMRELLNRRLHTREDLTDLGLPFLVELADSARGPRKGIRALLPSPFATRG